LKYKNIVAIDKTEFEEEGAQLKEEPMEEVKKAERQEATDKRAKLNKPKLIFGIAIIGILIFAVLLSYPKISKNDNISDILLDLPIRRQRETIGPSWHRDEEILQFHPYLIIIHFSGFNDSFTN
jgi:hypothetical protein